MISYTRNFEDVMIHRALKHIEQGFYIDVGASHPVGDSNTYALYTRGWRGVAVEPQTIFNAEWLQHRPEDLLLNAALGASEGEMTLFKPIQYGQAATINPAFATDYAARGLELEQSTVRVHTLTQVLEQVRPTGDIHLLSIDVEGAERDVIAGLDWQRFRPWLVMLESTLPGVPTPNYDQWEPLLLSQGYEFAYFDAVNRYYVATERSDLKVHFTYPPCVWDDFVSHEVVHLRERNAALEQQVGALQAQAQAVEPHLKFYHQRLNAATELLLAQANALLAKGEDAAYGALLWKINEAVPEFEQVHWDLGRWLVGHDQRAEALVFYTQTAQIFPTNRYTPNNIALLLRWEKRWAESEAAFRHALELDPGFSEARMNLGALLLALGRYAEGWEAFEARYLVSPHETPRMTHNAPFERWTGQPLEGKAVLVMREQGYGDEIMFVRFVQQLKQRGARHVTILCQPAIRTLLATAPGVDQVVCAEDLEAWPEHDFWVYEQSLPHALGVTLKNLSAPIPYLFAKDDARQQWRERLQQLGLAPSTLKVGLTWRGSSQHGNDKHRSLPHLSVLKPLWDVPNIQFVSIQTAEAAAQANPAPEGQPIVECGSQMADFADGAALISELDLVITVDTAIAHLAGAMGIACWVMIPVVETDWRWLIDRTDSPWYPVGMRIYRQTVDHQWGEVLAQIQADLAVLAASKAC